MLRQIIKDLGAVYTAPNDQTHRMRRGEQHMSLAWQPRLDIFCQMIVLLRTVQPRPLAARSSGCQKITVRLTKLIKAVQLPRQPPTPQPPTRPCIRTVLCKLHKSHESRLDRAGAASTHSHGGTLLPFQAQGHCMEPVQGRHQAKKRAAHITPCQQCPGSFRSVPELAAAMLDS
jgi:hypothetical protein